MAKEKDFPLKELSGKQKLKLQEMLSQKPSVGNIQIAIELGVSRNVVKKERRKEVARLGMKQGS
jgi:hypothetical protein